MDFKKIDDYLSGMGAIERPENVFISIPNAKEMLMNGINYFTGGNGTWLPEYETIAEWMADNKGRGLLCLGSVGRGKSLICTKVLPVLFSHYHRKIVSIYDAQQMNRNIDEVLNKHIICIDDLGTEEIAVKYGERRLAFAELADAAEKKGKLLLVTTNMNIEELRNKYSDRVIDRLRATTKSVLFNGESLRR